MHQSCDFPPSISLCFLGEYEASPYHTTPTQAVSSFFTPLFNYHPCLPSYPLLTIRSCSVLVTTSIARPSRHGYGWWTGGFITIRRTKMHEKEKVRWGHVFESPTTVFAYPGTPPLPRVASLPILLPLSFSSLCTPLTVSSPSLVSD